MEGKLELWKNMFDRGLASSGPIPFTLQRSVDILLSQWPSLCHDIRSLKLSLKETSTIKWQRLGFFQEKVIKYYKVFFLLDFN